MAQIFCETRGSQTVGWASDEYIGQGDIQLKFGNFSPIGKTLVSPLHPSTTAILAESGLEGDVYVLISILSIVASTDSTVACIDEDAGISSNTSVRLLDMCQYTMIS